MQLKFKRYTGTKGLLSKSTTYILEALLHTPSEEEGRITASGQWGYVLSVLAEYGSDDTEFIAKIRNISIGDLRRGVIFEYTNFPSVLRTELFLLRVCKNVLSTANTLTTFDGTERVVEVEEDRVQLVAAG